MHERGSFVPYNNPTIICTVPSLAGHVTIDLRELSKQTQNLHTHVRSFVSAKKHKHPAAL